MIRKVSLEEISDGRLYEANDMVKTDCGDCKGCFACCCGMGSSIVLDPLDVYRLCKGLKQSFSQLLADRLDLNVVDGIILPNLKMTGQEDRCSFLNSEGRCTIHEFRPGICRMFPLGRYYEGDSFRYFLQVHECRNQNRTKIKVKKWLDTPELPRYEQYVKDWHHFLKELQEQILKVGDNHFSETKAKEISMALLGSFYVTPFLPECDFYNQFYERLQEAKEELL
ncbi:MAG: YkgJ family cysteine cluster protein [Brotaphodocola sp.]